MATYPPLRFIAAAGLLALIWVVVYWIWRPAAPDAVPSSELPPPSGELAIVDPLLDPNPETPASSSTRRTEPPAASDDAERTDPSDTGSTGGGIVPPEFEPYTIRSGDSFQSIARARFGRSSLWTVVARANPTVDPNRIRAGMVIRLPLDPGNIQGIPEDETIAAESESPTIEYTVQSGDTLSEIAAKFYGSPRFTDFLFEANRDRLRSPAAIRLGQTLLIPPKPAESP